VNEIAHVRTRRRWAGSSILRIASYIFILAGMGALGYTAYVIASVNAYQAIEIRAIESAKPFSHPKPERTVPAEGSVIGEIQIPRLALKAVISEGDSAAILQRAVAHIPGTPLPGEIGNVALAGHRDTFFRSLRNIRPGDGITLVTPDRSFLYRVRSTAVVPPTDMQVLQSSGGRELTLITCYPFDYVGSAPNRFVVRAVETEQAQE
jgi:sortase A